MMTMLMRSSAIRLRLRASKYRCLTRWKQSREREKAGGARDSKPMPSGFHVVDLSPFSKVFALRPWLDTEELRFCPRGQVPCQLSKFFEKGENRGILKVYGWNAYVTKFVMRASADLSAHD